MNLEYVGETFPKWVVEGVRVKVVRNAITKRFGLAILPTKHDRTWPGEVGTIVRSEGNGWWDWSVEFPRGLTYRFDERRPRESSPCTALKERYRYGEREYVMKAKR